MTNTSNADETPRLTVVVSDIEDVAKEVPETIDPELYNTSEREDSRVEFDLEADDELVEALRKHGYEFEFE